MIWSIVKWAGLLLVVVGFGPALVTLIAAGVGMLADCPSNYEAIGDRDLCQFTTAVATLGFFAAMLSWPLGAAGLAALGLRWIILRTHATF